MERRRNDGEPQARLILRQRSAAAVKRALRNGQLPRLDGSIPCAYCKERPAVLFDHRSYFRPLDVQPSCKSCNRKLGAAEPIWLPDRTAAIARPLSDLRQIELTVLVERGSAITDIGQALGISRERARQLIWSRGLRAAWIGARKRRRLNAQRVTETIRIQRWLTGHCGQRSMFVKEAQRQGLDLRLERGRKTSSGFIVEGCPVAVRKMTAGARKHSGNRPDHPGYLHPAVTPGCLNVIYLADGRTAFIAVHPDQSKHIAIRPDVLQTEWPTVQQWRDLAAFFAGFNNHP